MRLTAAKPRRYSIRERPERSYRSGLLCKRRRWTPGRSERPAVPLCLPWFLCCSLGFEFALWSRAALFLLPRVDVEQVGSTAPRDSANALHLALVCFHNLDGNRIKGPVAEQSVAL